MVDYTNTTFDYGGISMKKICKRFLALAMIATMAVSSNITCFAAELDESSGVADSDGYVDVIDVDVCSDSLPNGGVVDLVIDKDGTVSFVEPRTTLLSASGSNESSTTTWSNDFYTDRSGILHVRLTISGSCHINVKLKLNGSWITTNWVNDNVSSGTADYYSKETISGGSYAKVTLNSFSSGSNWSISAWVAK